MGDLKELNPKIQNLSIMKDLMKHGKAFYFQDNFDPGVLRLPLRFQILAHDLKGVDLMACGYTIGKQTRDAYRAHDMNIPSSNPESNCR